MLGHVVLAIRAAADITRFWTSFRWEAVAL